MRESIRICSIGLAAVMLLLAGCLPASRRSTGSPGGSPGGGSAPLATAEGEASYYADNLEGHPTASGEPYRRSELTAAHRTYPFGTMLRVINTRNGRDVVVRVNDRGPFKASRVVDLSRRAAESLMMIADGVTTVRIEVIQWGG